MRDAPSSGKREGSAVHADTLTPLNSATAELLGPFPTKPAGQGPYLQMHPYTPVWKTSVQRHFVSIHLCMVEAAESSLSKDRLTREQWIAHGLRTLARHGAAALKTGMLAEGLQVSRGSFYWHFESIADFRTQLLAIWQERATDGVIREIDSSIVGPARLTHLMKLAFNEDRSLDRAFRSWAASDADAAKVVATVDAGRVAYIAKLLRESGVDFRASVPRAEFIYWAYIGQSSVMNSAHGTITEADLGDLSGLFSRPSS